MKLGDRDYEYGIRVWYRPNRPAILIKFEGDNSLEGKRNFNNYFLNNYTIYFTNTKHTQNVHFWWFCVVKNVFRISFDPFRVLFGVTEFRFVKILFTTSVANVTSTKRNSVTPKSTWHGSKLIRKTFFTTQNHHICTFLGSLF